MPSHLLDPPKFTAKPLKELKNSSKGELLEKHWSEVLHPQGVPLLVSSRLLRKYGCGQIDICLYKNGLVILFEIKSVPEGLNHIQYNRLKKSLELLTAIFNVPGHIEFKSHCQKN